MLKTTDSAHAFPQTCFSEISPEFSSYFRIFDLGPVASSILRIP